MGAGFCPCLWFREPSMKRNVVQEKSFAFAVRIVHLARFLRHDLKEYDLCSQILRSGTSIGANVEEGIGAGSRKDFLYKMTLARKEARETQYWLRLLVESVTVSREKLTILMDDCAELIRLLNSIIKSTEQECPEVPAPYDLPSDPSLPPIRNS